jgi:hypothetical protein
MGKTLLLLELAARISTRCGQNVLFHSAHKPSLYLAKNVVLRGDARVYFADESVLQTTGYDAGTDQPAIHLLDSSSAAVDRVYTVTNRLQHAHPVGCAVLILDGWSTYTERLVQFEVIDGNPHYPGERWPHLRVSPETLVNAQRFTLESEIPVLMGITTASLMDNDTRAESFGIETEVRVRADRLLTLHGPEIYCDTASVKAEGRHVVNLTGTCPQWWDTRCAKLRFEARRLTFSTVV